MRKKRIANVFPVPGSWDHEFSYLKLIYIVFRGPKKYSEVLSPVKICMVLALDLVRLHLLSRIPFLALDYIDFLVSLPCFPQSFVRLGIFYDFWCLPRAEKG